MTARKTRFQVRPLTATIGAEVEGVRISEDVPQAEIDELRAIWLRYNVIFIRDQELTSGQYLAFASRFGNPVEYPLLNGLDGFPMITPVIKREHETVNFGGIWHSDTVYLEKPPMGTMLLAREIPPQGGDTMFADQYAAFEALSDRMKELLSGLTAIHSSSKADASKTREDRASEAGRDQKTYLYESEHPVVRTHPETGRKALYVNRGHTVRFSGMTEEESAPLLEFLYRHTIKPEFTCRFRWSVGALALWDNRCTMHYPVNDYHGYLRVMHRITLEGDTPR